MADHILLAHFVFVHGACHGAWCWYMVRTLLESVGHNVTCIDLASAGIDPSDANKITTFEEYNRPLTDFMASLPEDEKVILVGHSAGGSSVTDAIYKFGEKIKLAVYVVAGMIRKNAVSKAPAFSKEDVIYNYGLGPSNPPTSLIFRKEALHRLLYNRSPQKDSTLASMLIRPAPILKPSEEENISSDYVDKVRRVYVRTGDDHMISVARQNVMIEGWEPWKVFDVDSDHSPFFSAPAQLFSILVEVTNLIATD